MKKYKLDDFINKENLNKGKKLQILINETKRGSQRQRSPKEAELLIKAMLKDVKKLESEGVIEKNGRTWKFNI